MWGLVAFAEHRLVLADPYNLDKFDKAGRAAHAGLVSARLAALGFTAAADALEPKRCSGLSFGSS